MPDRWTPQSKVAKAVYAAGFRFDPEQDIILSRMDAWQRDFGYAYAYDLLAPISISANIDCEPFFFEYDNKKWMIEVWKGQYGMETGGEVGIYVCEEDRPLLDSTLGHRPYDKQNSQFFECAEDNELLNISFTLFRNGKELFCRKAENHWWSTGFMWGVFSDPQDLKMEIVLTFDNMKMLSLFEESISKAGYDYNIKNSNSIHFTFESPKTYQPRKNPDWKEIINNVNDANRSLVERYQSLELENNDPNNIRDKRISSEIIGYFNLYSPKKIRKHIIKYLKGAGHSAREIVEILEASLKIKLGPLMKFIMKLP